MEEQPEPIVVYLSESPDILLSPPLLLRHKSNRPRRTVGSNPATFPVSYQQLWPVLNAAKDRAVELTEEGHQKKEQSVKQLHQWELPDAGERLARFSRNLPEQEKFFQIQTVGDLPMFRFG